MGGSVSQVHAGAEQSHQLLLVVGDVPLHDLLTGAQETLKRLDVYYCRGREREGCGVREKGPIKPVVFHSRSEELFICRGSINGATPHTHSLDI